jgi:hypothetical protein
MERLFLMSILVYLGLYQPLNRQFKFEVQRGADDALAKYFVRRAIVKRFPGPVID